AQLRAMGADVSYGRGKVTRDGVLHGQVPGANIPQLEIWIHRLNSTRRGVRWICNRVRSKSGGDGTEAVAAFQPAGTDVEDGLVDGPANLITNESNDADGDVAGTRQ